MITIICVGKLKEKWQREGCQEYQKRLSRYGGVEIIEVNDRPEPQNSSEALERQLKEREGKDILSRVKQTDKVIALCIDGGAPDSVELSKKLQSWSMEKGRLVFVIGGSLGLSGEVIGRADVRLSFSHMTFPHGLMRVILLEQLYRAMRIGAGEPYHK